MEITANAVQTVAANQDVLFTNVAIAGNSSTVHRSGSGQVTLRGLTNCQCRARFRVTFGGNINGVSWRILLVPPTSSTLARSDGSLASGVCDNDTKCIYINENLNSSLMKRVLCHEITHAAMFSYETDLTVEQEELLADLIATYGQEIISKTNDIFQRLKANKGDLSS